MENFYLLEATKNNNIITCGARNGNLDISMFGKGLVLKMTKSLHRGVFMKMLIFGIDRTFIEYTYHFDPVAHVQLLLRFLTLV